jgi:hypothetical protein
MPPIDRICVPVCALECVPEFNCLSMTTSPKKSVAPAATAKHHSEAVEFIHYHPRSSH